MGRPGTGGCPGGWRWSRLHRASSISSSVCGADAIVCTLGGAGALDVTSRSTRRAVAGAACTAPCVVA